MAQGEPTESTTIASQVNICFDQYEQICGILVTTESRIQQKLPPGAVSDSFGRFRLWVGNLGAHRQGRSSIDYKLREASHIKARVIKLLQRMQKYQQEAIQICSGLRISGEDVSDSDSDLSDLPGENFEPQHQTELQQLVSNMNEISICLMRLSMTIRNPAPHDQFKSSNKINASHFEVFDVEHVREKFPSTNDYLVQRLGKAISRRRQYLRYREEHREKLEQGIEKNDGGHPTKTPGSIHEIQSTIASSIPQAIKLNVSVDELEKSTDFDESLSQTSYASSTYDASKLCPPPLPEAGRNGDPFECPLCRRITSVRQVLAWYKHVYRDLQPYVCTFEVCGAADRTYESRHDWFQHELQAHRVTWECIDGCNQTFSHKNSFRNHFTTHHVELMGIDETRIDDIIRNCEREATTDVEVQCPLCQEKVASLALLCRHLGRHQQELSLFALPSHMQGDDESGEATEDNSSAVSSHLQHNESDQQHQYIQGSDPDLALFVIEKSETDQDWSEVEPRYQNIHPEDLRARLAEFRRKRIPVKSAVDEIPSSYIRRHISELVEEESNKLWAANQTLQWKLASVDVKWKIINRKSRQVKRVSLILKTVPSGFPYHGIPKPASSESSKSPHLVGEVDRFGATKFARACEKGDLEEAQKALQEAPDELDQMDYAGIAPLQKASLHGHADIVNFLVQKGCSVLCQSNNGDTPLIDAVENGHLEVVKLLLHRGHVDPHHANKKGQRAIDVLDVEDKDHDQIERILREAMRVADRITTGSFDTSEGTGGTSAQGTKDDHEQSNRLLYNDQNVEILTELAGTGDIYAEAELIYQNVRPTIASGVAAAKNGHYRILTILLASGLEADPDPSEHAETPMIAAIKGRHSKIVQLLLEQDGFNPTRRNGNGKTYHGIAEEEEWDEGKAILKHAFERFERRQLLGNASNISEPRHRTRIPIGPTPPMPPFPTEYRRSSDN